ncbi:hypothetical protein U5801_22845 [Lamprobacter modestohalophilus]|uniref:hypothetical protein n=1 Tax=Lamprobacter modestohalophilus TaxID=1064514 RepID=UPI002ADEED89|nr:hypothetical protein [Lamprobacter modestohalophilus]MEA1052624.1 hypothetical protein [Lamprobacter modestohalophilus]
MRGTLLSPVLISVVLLAGCAAGGSRDDGSDALEAPGAMRADRATGLEGEASVSGGGLGAGSPGSAAASVTFEAGGPERQRGSGEPPIWPNAGLLFDQDLFDQDVFDQGVLYAMAYLPSSSNVETERANSLAELYADARPGYDLYTFVLGGPVGPQPGTEAAAYDELLRVIETYVLGNPAESGAARGQHGFLVQVDPLLDGQFDAGLSSGVGSEAEQASDAGSSAASLAERARPGLSLQMQVALARQLRVFGHVELADRLESSSGPFLVSSLRPALIPMSAQEPLLIVDLHNLGPEYMYSLIDAYDRPIPSELRGRPESLSAIGHRVQGMFPNRRLDAGAEPPPSGTWIWLIGEPGQNLASAAATF